MLRTSKEVLQDLLKVYKIDGFGPAFKSAFEKELRQAGLLSAGPLVKGSQRNGKRSSNRSFSGYGNIDDDVKK